MTEQPLKVCAFALAEELNADFETDITYIDMLDTLGRLGLTLTQSPENVASLTYMEEIKQLSLSKQ